MYPNEMPVETVTNAVQAIKKGAGAAKPAAGDFDQYELHRALTSFNQGRKLVAAAVSCAANASKEQRALSSLGTLEGESSELKSQVTALFPTSGLVDLAGFDKVHLDSQLRKLVFA